MMKDRDQSPLSPRRLPQQDRAVKLVEAILEAAEHVLRRDGEAGFTVSRVAEKAGVSVGSLYQYFASKDALVYRMQLQEWRRNGAALRSIMADKTKPATERLRVMIHAFLDSECEETALRRALGDAAPNYHDALELEDDRVLNNLAVQTFMKEMLPGAGRAQRDQVADIIFLAMTAIGSHLSKTNSDAPQIATCAATLAKMAIAYVDEQNRAN